MAIYPAMSFGDYRSLHALNWSNISKLLSDSPKQVQYVIDNPDDEEASYFTLGRAVHSKVLEPELFDAEFVSAPDFGPLPKADGTPVSPGARGYTMLSAYKRKLAGFAKKHEAKTILSASEFAQVVDMATSVSLHRMAQQVLSGALVEQSITWADPVTGLECKARIDAVCGGRVSDLKTSMSISPRAFTSSVWKYGYAGQLAYYFDGAIHAGLDVDPTQMPCLVAVQKLKPYEVAVYRANHDVLAVGRMQYRKCLDLAAKCIRDDYWPGHADNTELEIEVPAWALRGIEANQENAA